MGQVRVVGDHDPPVAVPAQDLTGRQAEAAERPEGSGLTALVLGAHGEGRVLQHHDPVTVGNRSDRVEIGWVTEQVDRKDHPGPWGDRLF